MTSEEHKAVIDRLEKLQEQKKAIARKILSVLDLKVTVAGSVEARTAQRKKLLAVYLRETDGLFTAVSKLGKEFAETKLADGTRP